MRHPITVFLVACIIGCLIGGAATPVRADPEPTLEGLPDDPTNEGDEGDSVPPLSPDQVKILSMFQEPNLSPQQTAAVLAQYQFIDPKQVIHKALRDRAIVYFHHNKHLIRNQRVLSVIDYSLRSRIPRFHLIDLATGEVVSLRVAHGSGSDPDNTGVAVRFSNTPQSKMSSLGFLLTAEEYQGSHGRSLRLDGLSPTNSNVRPRAIVIHGADYVEDADVKPGRSWGCPAVSMENHRRVIDAVREGSLILGATH